MELPEPIRDAMVAHARFAYPDEACGLLAGKRGALRMAYCLTNVDASPRSFTLDPEEHFRAIQHAESCGWEIVGVYHSHPATAAYPSRTDVTRALDPEWLYVIVGPAAGPAPEVRGYRIRRGVVSEERLGVPHLQHP